ncbi:dephospho-CoA kinase, partial [Staphylococcus saprophyticus]|uniref:dephospho-CoA kinase n=1 Tax=Staphylococcus saprophyticus TaxID=29385 RepID=UPI0012472ACA
PKSTLSQLLTPHPFKILDPHIPSPQPLQKPTKPLQPLKEPFRHQPIDQNPQINTPYLPQLLFNQPQNTLQLNQILHPILRQIIQKQKPHTHLLKPNLTQLQPPQQPNTPHPKPLPNHLIKQPIPFQIFQPTIHQTTHHLKPYQHQQTLI